MCAHLSVGLGGLLGSAAPYGVSVARGPMALERFPWAMLAANCLGCLLIGLVAGAFPRAAVPESVRPFLVTDILGGFTTFSALGLESLVLLRGGDISLAVWCILGSVAVDLAAVWLRFRTASAAEAYQLAQAEPLRGRA